ncbi:MAG TPA: DUF2254 family protein [Xanthobacteraceae bacterium]|jgi:uncharacterized membrane protein|nr:DUF2254 family protein [Xanthobacteraceae bacterium]
MTNVATSIRNRVFEAVRRAFKEFLGLPIAMVVCFVVFAGATYIVDEIAWSNQNSIASLKWLARLLGDAKAIGNLLGIVASSIITVTSITFSLLLIAVQQGASALTSQVFDQFLRRRSNQLYFGYFVGLCVYVLLTLATVSDVHRPIFGALVAIILTSAALCIVVVLIYNTIDQMRPAEIVKEIHHYILRARQTQKSLLEQTRRKTSGSLTSRSRICSSESGFLSKIDIGAIRTALLDDEKTSHERLEIEMLAGIGAYIAYGDPLIDIHSMGPPAHDRYKAIRDTAVRAITFDDGRDLNSDPSFGIEQLAIIGWTSVSTAKSNPMPGILVCQSLRDILARWAADGTVPEDAKSPVVYTDRVTQEAIEALESLAVVASESMQHQTLAEIMRTLSILLLTLPHDRVRRVEETILRSLSALGEHVLTHPLEASLQDVQQALRHIDRGESAEKVAQAVSQFRKSYGRLNSRATRVPQNG